jgi:hypothetical protein
MNPNADSQALPLTILSPAPLRPLLQGIYCRQRQRRYLEYSLTSRIFTRLVRLQSLLTLRGLQLTLALLSNQNANQSLHPQTICNTMDCDRIARGGQYASGRGRYPCSATHSLLLLNRSPETPKMPYLWPAAIPPGSQYPFYNSRIMGE